jgi:hypothetical protein
MVTCTTYCNDEHILLLFAILYTIKHYNNKIYVYLNQYNWITLSNRFLILFSKVTFNVDSVFRKLLLMLTRYI